MATKLTVGFIGLGIMGKPMCRNLMRAGYALVVYDINPAAIEEFVGAGAEPAKTPAEVARKSGLIITMLPDGPDVEKVVLGEHGILAGLRPGAVLLDMSSISPVTARKVASMVEAKGGSMLDAPVSGGEPKANDGTLAIMVGGDKEVFKTSLPILQKLGSSITYVGGPGCGQIAKLANQMIVAANIGAVSEALVFSSKAGVDPELVIKAIRGGLAGSAVMEAKATMMMDRNFKPGFRLRLHQKDLKNALAAGKEYGVPLRMTQLMKEIVDGLVADGKGDLDHSAILLSVEGTARAKVNRKAG